MNPDRFSLLKKQVYPPLGSRPVEILESRLCRDPETMRIALFLMLQNISGKEISSVTVDICCFDDRIQLLLTKPFTYTGLSVEDGADFGLNIPIYLSSLRTASVTATLRKVVYRDQTLWQRASYSPILESAQSETAKSAPSLKSKRQAQRTAEELLWLEDKTPSQAAANTHKKQKRRLYAGLLALLLLLGVGFGIGSYSAAGSAALDTACALYHSGDYAEAADALDRLGSHCFMQKNRDRLLRYRALSKIQTGAFTKAIQDLKALDGRLDSSSCLRYLGGMLSGLAGAGERHSVALKTDGTVLAAGDNRSGQCEVTEWTDMVAVAAGLNHTLGLKADGTLEAVGDDTYSQCALGSWENVLAIAAGEKHSVGLLKNGKVITAGANDYGQCNTADWSGIVAIAAGRIHTVGLRQDGTVVAAGDNDMGACNVSSWQDIIAIAAGNGFTLGVRADGTVLAVGDNTYRECETASLENAVFVTAGDFHALTLRADGQAQGVGDNDWRQCETAIWTRLIAAAGGVHHSIGICQDGTAYAVGDNKYGQCSLSFWSNLGLPENAPAKSAFMME